MAANQAASAAAVTAAQADADQSRLAAQQAQQSAQQAESDKAAMSDVPGAASGEAAPDGYRRVRSETCLVRWQGVLTALDRLKSAAPAPTVVGSPAQ
jgi:hypothetical protein